MKSISATKQSDYCWRIVRITRSVRICSRRPRLVECMVRIASEGFTKSCWKRQASKNMSGSTTSDTHSRPGNSKRHRPENGRGNSRSRLGRILTGRVYPCDSRHEKRSRAENQRLHGKCRITARNEQESTRRLPELLRQAANFLIRRFLLRIPVWVAFGSNGKVTKFSIGKSSEYAEKSS